jgi:hypothetical protein
LIKNAKVYLKGLTKLYLIIVKFEMVLSREALEAKPKRPKNIYMLWRLKKLPELKD